ncbi:BirA family transcriptional regulator, biotin operon repressor / biotin-[acetyl-CoA-carboxylase] ligase [Roseivivax halotolerans]|uniref:biotin--[biotin carboxyl-carrier protein] ligase n=1 Tax=Roseivivax halotolerans TaxID=93684 RepID=A0A1I5XRK1_9RHOB|nr:biotin--[acetyl-CoA-carboxylase] ligase [Roseivivax halotolerans]SFQ34611.1 BirA family transcriptional regulator, biotin operon repressor / biotin-[acetyl-CoA-carboxylase] ligase [Roseivivax halotolerans]
MSAISWPEGYARLILDEVDSTNAEAARQARTSSGPIWIMAHRQTAARGRRGRAWRVPEGNFSATLLLMPSEPPELVALRSFVAALALFDTCVRLTGRVEPFALKWPNDVLLNGGKLAGILLETLGNVARVDHLAIGIGVNLIAAPDASEVEDGAVRPVALLPETGADPTPETFLDHLAADFARHETSLKTYGFAPIREAWLSRAARLGEVITARTGSTETRGTFETVDARGNLVLKTPEGRVSIAAADVFF